ncbi:MAG: biopolymer transport protein ExbB [Methylobacteriaceae bacterium]|jgi:biopolymer transport protein ExbB|nr:biopolymer transport protein ExbB [Methylobacteriaceae bacterium]
MKYVGNELRAALLALALCSAPLAIAQTGGGAPAEQLPAAAVQAEPPTAVPPSSAPALSEAPAAPGAPADAPRSIVPSAAIPRDLSPWSMFLSADIVVKAVMIGLAFASLITWTIFLAKTIELLIARRRVADALQRIEPAASLSQAHSLLEGKQSVLADFIAAAANEMHLSRRTLVDSTGVKERAATSFAEITRTEARGIRRGMGALATIGATAPFVGLFGTVWGIMNSFIGISKSQTTNLAVVAPGIAEALLATAIGLVAAIPAVIIYNHFSRGTRGYLDLVGRASGAVARLLSRDLDRAGSGMISRAAE